jgi:hypothetical protein
MLLECRTNNLIDFIKKGLLFRKPFLLLKHIEFK